MTQPLPDLSDKTPGMHIWGWISPQELRWLGSHAENMANVVEIGSLRGRSAYMLLTKCKGPVYCIDPWDDPGGHGYPAFMTACGGFPNLVAIRDFSPQAGAKVPGRIDMVWIDGDHTYEGVKADVEYWFPRTNKLICGHDYNHGGWPGVNKAVKEFFGPLGLEIQATSGMDGMYHVEGGASIWYVYLGGYNGTDRTD